MAEKVATAPVAADAKYSSTTVTLRCCASHSEPTRFPPASSSRATTSGKYSSAVAGSGTPTTHAPSAGRRAHEAQPQTEME